ncbi:hypothetical protein [Nocardia lijiangensis]|uniref:hypothetical protein n=1 Tax=Nocardia lijiangensis TaxID=299618 RepID=UPI000A58AF5B|nr:hypothetical protein [Nocardia lijiangensis]
MALEWLAVVGTLGGAAVGASSTMFVDALRARRERSVRVEDTQRQTYVKCLMALTQTDNAMQALAIGRTPLDRAEATAAFRSNQLVAAIYELELVAPQSVCDAAWLTYDKLRDIREALIAQSMTVGRADAGSPEWRAVHEPFLAALEQLREAMRRQLGSLERVQPQGSA